MDTPESAGNGHHTLPQWPAVGDRTSDESVDAILSNLAQLSDLPVPGHQPVYQQIHDDLLADLETGAD